MHLRAEQVDALTAGDLRVETVFLRDRADDDQLVRRDLTAGHARHDGVGAVLLHVREKVVVRVLQHGLVALQHELVPARGEDRRDRRLADVAAQAAAMLVANGGERLQLADAHEVEQLLARIGEVLAEMVVDRDAAACELGFQDLSHERAAAAAGCCGFRRGS